MTCTLRLRSIALSFAIAATAIACAVDLDAGDDRAGDEGAGDETTLAGPAPLAAVVELHGAPSYMPRSSDYAVKVNGSAVPVLSDVNGYDYVHFSMSGGPVSIEVTASQLATIAAHSISPIRDNLAGTVSGNRLTYSLPGDGYTIVSIQGVGEKLIVAADPIEAGPDPAAAHVFDVMSFPGVKNDRNNIGNTTNGIQAAIHAASQYAGSANQGRGVVYVPAGAYAVGNLTLESDMELYLAPGAAFFFASNVAGDQWNYSYRTDWTSKGNGTRWITTQDGASGIRIWGRGTLDGNAHGTGDFYNNLLVVNNSHDVRVDGIVIKSGSKWGTIVGRSDDVRIDHVKFFQDMWGVGENDALDVVESQDVTVEDSIGVSFDDPFSVKSYATFSSYVTFGGAFEPSADLVFQRLIAWTGCHAFKIGQGVAQPTHDIRFADSVVFDAAHAVSLHHKTGAATARDITWDGLDIQKIGQTNLGRSWAYFHIEPTGPGAVEEITVKHIRVRDFGTEPSPLNGLDSTHGIAGIYFRNLYVGPTGAGSYAQNAADAHLQRNPHVSNLQVSENGVRRFRDRDAVRIEGAADWSFGNYKASCGPGEAATGMSQPAALGPNALRCKAYGASFTDAFAAAHAVWGDADHDRGATHATYDWDPGHAKSECGSGEYVSGVSQEPGSHAIAHLRCAAAAIAGDGCNSKSVRTDDRGEQTGDWDPGAWKAECANEMVMVGVSVDADRKPRRILCCHR